MGVSRLKYPTFFNMSASKGGRASGGTVTRSESYTIHTFSTANSPDWFVVNDATLLVDILLVGGGGAGGYWGGGGGAGGYVSAMGVTLQGDRSYPIIVGAGGTPTNTTLSTGPHYFGGPGQASQFGTYVAIGGGGGAAHISNVQVTINTRSIANGGQLRFQHGGSGGGGGGGESGYSTVGGYALTDFAFSGTSQGNTGGSGRQRDEGISGYAGQGGGGGAGAVGTPSPGLNGGNGGNGLENSISGTSVTYAGGGGGGSRGATQGLGGSGGGGAGSYTITQNNGTNGLGGGGGANFHESPGSSVSFAGANGGSGIVIVRYLT
jgi:hypothetical protein